MPQSLDIRDDDVLPMLSKLLAHVDPGVLEQALKGELKRGTTTAASTSPPTNTKTPKEDPAKTLQLLRLQNTNLSNRVHLANVEQTKTRDELQQTQAALESERERKAVLQKQLQDTLEDLQHGSWKRALESELDDLRTDIARYEQQKTQMDSEIHVAQRERKMKLALKQSLEQQAADLRQDNEALRHKVRRINTKLLTAENQHTTRLGELVHQTENIQTKVDDLQRANHKLSAELDACTTRMRDMPQTHREQSDDHTRRMVDLRHALEKEQATQSQRSRDLEEVEGKLRDETAQHEKRMTRIRKEHAELETRHARTSEDVRDKTLRIDALQKELEQVRTTIEQERGQREDLETQNQDLMQQLTNLGVKKASLDTQLTALERQLAQAREQVDALPTLQELASHQSVLQNQLRDMNAQVDDLTEREKKANNSDALEQALQAKTELSRAKAQNEEQRRTLQQRTKVMRAKQKQVAALEEEVQQSELTEKRARKALDALHEEEQDLATKIKETQESTERSNEALSQLTANLQNQRQQLQDSGILEERAAMQGRVRAQRAQYLRAQARARQMSAQHASASEHLQRVAPPSLRTRAPPPQQRFAHHLFSSISRASAMR